MHGTGRVKPLTIATETSILGVWIGSNYDQTIALEFIMLFDKLWLNLPLEDSSLFEMLERN